ncbi:hypothetical protein GGQ87_000243 [Brevundimonas alba]|uniref:Uncharacterized protein n=1 Tax=Brevundimonas alba TaxID=74314 RepID=A0A7X5YK71_9CAUL|nr:hypothetical protein [Brevundimonas alba]NJC39985.1 hypothetical protein [Brevundimonas alba]
MSRSRTNPEDLLLDLDAWEAPLRLSAEDLYAHAGADRRDGAHPVDDPEDER